jgi:hypothetical protein
MAKKPSRKSLNKVSVTARFQRLLHQDVVKRDADKFTGGFTEIVERLLVGQMKSKRGLAHKFPVIYVREEGK